MAVHRVEEYYIDINGEFSKSLIEKIDSFLDLNSFEDGVWLSHRTIFISGFSDQQEAEKVNREILELINE